MASPRGGLREEADPGEEVGVAATGLSVAATARRRPKTPGGDRAEKGLTGRSAWPRRSPREGAAGVAVVPRPHRGGRELPECRLAAGLNAVVATGLAVAAQAGQTGQPRRAPGHTGERGTLVLGHPVFASGTGLSIFAKSNFREGKGRPGPPKGVPRG